MAIFRILVAVVLTFTLAASTLAGGDEIEEAMALMPNLENGLRIYEKCAICHAPTGWGENRGRYPQIAGQYVNVIIKQLIDIRNGDRDNPTMYPFSQHRMLGGPQNVSDIAAYVARLPISLNNEKGPGTDLEHGAKLYKDHCAKCHGVDARGDNDKFCPRIQGQHFSYLLRQFQWFKSGQRHNVDTAMIRRLKDFSERDMIASADFVSRLRPPPELTAPVGWHNPDFPTTFVVAPLAPFNVLVH
jgi:cytochrome c553